MKIIPAIDVMSGKCVRLSQGDFNSQKVYSDDPVAVAQQFEQQGMKYLHVVDLDGARSGETMNLKVLKDIVQNTNLKVDFSGGISDDSAIDKAFESGANQVTIGSMAIKKPDLFRSWMEKYGVEKIILGLDVFDNRIKIRGWLEDAKLDVFDYLDGIEEGGLRYLMCTDISKDGMLIGPSFELYKQLLIKYPFELIASGGITSVEDVLKLKAIGASGAIIGKAIYEGLIDLKKLNELC